MIKIKMAIKIDTTVSAYVDLGNKVYSVEFGTMSDLFHPIRIARNMILWIDDDGIIGELESIGPREYTGNLLDLSCAESIAGIPVIEYVSPCEEPVCVINTPKGFVLLLSSYAKVDTLFQYENVSFLVSAGTLVGVCWNGEVQEASPAVVMTSK